MCAARSVEIDCNVRAEKAPCRTESNSKPELLLLRSGKGANVLKATEKRER